MSDQKQEHLTYTSTYFRGLSLDSKALAEALKKDSQLGIKKDEDGCTILHHVALLEEPDEFLQEIVEVLFKSEYLDFNAKDNKGSTPLHNAFRKESICESETPAKLLVEAQRPERKTDLTCYDGQGRSIYHLAALHGGFLIDTINKHVPHPDWNQFCASGRTPFCYALGIDSRNIFEDISKLLDAGADPTLYGFEGRDPLIRLQKVIDEFQKRSKEVFAEDDRERFDQLKGKFDALIAKVQTVLSERQSVVQAAITEVYEAKKADDRLQGKEGQTADYAFPTDIVKIIGSYGGFFSKPLPLSPAEPLTVESKLSVAADEGGVVAEEEEDGLLRFVRRYDFGIIDDGM